MITKKELSKFLDHYGIYNSAVTRIGKAISGSPYHYMNLFETDWGDAVENMLYAFLESNFTEEGIDWITYYLFEDVEDHVVTVTISEDLFYKEHEIEYHLNSVDELWDFLLTNKELYFKDAE